MYLYEEPDSENVQLNCGLQKQSFMRCPLSKI